MLHIDGTTGEGGGQVLRSSLALSVALGRAFRIDGIRAGRDKPGLLRQHLTAVRAAAAISSAEVGGDAPGSKALEFRPGAVRAGDYRFAIGSAGSAMLVLQAVLPPLLLADGDSTLVLEGGTHNPWAPPFPFVARTLVPLIEQLGGRVELELVRPGFYPAGGGEVRARVTPAHAAAALVLLERGAERSRSVEIVLAHLPRDIAEREWRVLRSVIERGEDCLTITECSGSQGPGNVICVHLDFANVCEVATGFGQRGVPARRVAVAPRRQVVRYLRATAPVGEHLADQLLLPMALLAGGRFRTLAPSSHTTTNVETIRAFLGDVITLEEHGLDDWLVEVRGLR